MLPIAISLSRNVMPCNLLHAWTTTFTVQESHVEFFTFQIPMLSWEFGGEFHACMCSMCRC